MKLSSFCLIAILLLCISYVYSQNIDISFVTERVTAGDSAYYYVRINEDDDEFTTGRLAYYYTPEGALDPDVNNRDDENNYQGSASTIMFSKALFLGLCYLLF